MEEETPGTAPGVSCMNGCTLPEKMSVKNTEKGTMPGAKG